VADHEHAEHPEHIVPPTTYIIIISTLLALTITTVLAAYVNLGPLNIVVLFFMHAKYSPKRTKLVIMSGIFWLAILLFMTLSDYASRVDYRGIRFPMTQNIVLMHSQHV
jgi:cytochrome c oxidase subunit 4